jgi:hypothetical protein
MLGRKKENGSVGKTELQGQTLHINPSPKTSLARKKARLAEVKKVLETGTIHVSRRRHFERAERRLVMEIKIAEGDY